MLFEKSLVNYYSKYYTIFWPLGADSFVARAANAGRIWEKPIVELFSEFVENGDTVLDVGSYIGSHAIPLSQLVGTSGRVFLFEPCADAYKCLIETQIYNNIDNWLIYKKAIYNCHTTLDFTTNNDGQSFIKSARPLKKHFNLNYGVETMTIDSLDLIECKFIKIDTEGAEWHVVDGAAETIKRCRPHIIIESFKSSKNQKRLIEFCHIYNYDMRYLSSANYYLRPNIEN